MADDEVTREIVLEALDKPPLVLADGRVQCRVCPRVVLSNQALAPHMLSHRRAVGLAPPRGQNRLPRRTDKRTIRQCPRCPQTIRSDNLRRHLMQVHGTTAREASDEAHTATVLPVPIEPAVGHPDADAAQFEAELPLSDLEAAEAVTGILMAARTDGVIPTRLLPHAIRLIEHTEAVLGELRRLTERGTQHGRPESRHRARSTG